METKSFEFGEFLLDGKEKLLSRRGQSVPLTPKAFELLRILVENHGRLIERSELLNTVWGDRVVEEGNLTFTIRLLRKALGDTKQNPRFIETVSKSGYRFIADVRITAGENFPVNEEKSRVFETTKKTADESRRLRSVFLPIAALLICGMIGLGLWYARNKNRQPAAPILAAPFASQKLSTTGKVIHAAISPDGKNVVYSNGSFNERQSLWLRQLESGSNIEIIPPSDHTYYGLEFSPDGSFLYFSRGPRGEDKRNIYRIPIFGGVPQKIVDETEGWMSISPDGAKISFVRCPYTHEENCSLWIADSADGKNERKLASRQPPFRIGDNRISPNGRSVAFAVGQSRNGANDFGLAEVDLGSGQEHALTDQKFFNIQNLAWLPDQNGLLLTASRIPTRNFQIWQVSLTTGDASPLTKDSETYSDLSLNKTTTELISTQVSQDFRLVVLSPDNLSDSRMLVDVSRVIFAPDGKIIFSSFMSGNDEIWSINPDGSGQRQLTNDPGIDNMPLVSDDNEAIFFTSNRTGSAQIWRMDRDGSNQTRITWDEGGFPQSISPDGKWIYYLHGVNRTLWQASTRGGQEKQLLNKRAPHFAFSPDRSQVAFIEQKGEERFIEVISLSDGKTVTSFNITAQRPAFTEVVWTPDSAGIVYISAEDNQNLSLRLQPRKGGATRKLADLGNERINSLAVSPDGKTFALAKGDWRHNAVLLRGLR